MAVFACDVECYTNYFLVKFKDYTTGEYVEFEQTEHTQLPVMALTMMMGSHEIHGFNFFGYDLPMITLALTGRTCKQLKDASDNIIINRVKPWDFYRQYGLREPNFNVIDLMEVAPGVKISLKMYAGRMHSKKMQDLPIDPAKVLDRAEMDALALYCGNDLDVTQDLSNGLQKRLDLRRALTQRYGIDLRSKSDAQVAEAVIKSILGGSVRRASIPPYYTFKFEKPDWVEFTTPYMQSILNTVVNTIFTVNDKQQNVWSDDPDGIGMPKELEGLDILIGTTTYRMGIGGLHSQEANRAMICPPGHELQDDDVKAYYPSLILRAGKYPASIGPRFIDIYQGFYNDRQTTQDKTENSFLKIVLNGTFGKLGSKFSILFAPELLIQTTITGQLAILMLIEAMEENGIKVVSANTDGIVTLCPAHLIPVRDMIRKAWMEATGLILENKRYRAIFNKSVNDYVAFTYDGEIKRKGTTFAVPGLEENKHPDREICADAAVAYLAHGTPVADTIRACRDIRKFVRIRRATHGAVFNQTGEMLGKAVRWYYGTDRTNKLLCGKSVRMVIDHDTGRSRIEGNLIASSTGAVPCMELPDTFPLDLDYEYYIDAAKEIINDVGVWHGRA